jgi:hypothetical protein
VKWEGKRVMEVDIGVKHSKAEIYGNEGCCETLLTNATA